MVAAFAVENQLARIVGTATPGRLVGSKSFKLRYGYFLILPVGAYVTWQGKRLEGGKRKTAIAKPSATARAMMRRFLVTGRSSENCHIIFEDNNERRARSAPVPNSDMHLCWHPPPDALVLLQNCSIKRHLEAGH